MAKELESVAAVVEVLGGSEVVMALTKCTSPSVVPVWKHRGKFPSRTYPVIQRALKQKGASAPDTLWNLERT